VTDFAATENELCLCLITLLSGEWALLGELLREQCVLGFNLLYRAFYFSYSYFTARAFSSYYLYLSSFCFQASESSLAERLAEEQALTFELITPGPDSLLTNNLSWCL
jgi:hypothetical protein